MVTRNIFFFYYEMNNSCKHYCLLRKVSRFSNKYYVSFVSKCLIHWYLIKLNLIVVLFEKVILANVYRNQVAGPSFC